MDIMALSGQRKGGCGHIMASFDTHIRCARCRENGTGSDPCVQGKDDCAACLLLTPEQPRPLTSSAKKTNRLVKQTF